TVAFLGALDGSGELQGSLAQYDDAAELAVRLRARTLRLRVPTLRLPGPFAAADARPVTVAGHYADHTLSLAATRGDERWLRQRAPRRRRRRVLPSPDPRHEFEDAAPPAVTPRPPPSSLRRAASRALASPPRPARRVAPQPGQPGRLRHRDHGARPAPAHVD